MKISLSPKNIILPLLVLAFVGVAVSFLSPFFTTTNRWAVLIAVMVYVISTGRTGKPLRTRFAITTIVAGLWGIATVIWSDVPLLSILKSIAFMMVSLTCIVAGYNWSLRTPPEKILDFLLPLTIAALLAGVLGRFYTSSYDYEGNIVLYQGLVYGPNMFGSMLAMCSPYLLWKTYYNWGRLNLRIAWLFLCLLGGYYLLAASSRGAMLIVLITMGGLFLTLRTGSRMQITVISIAAFAVLFICLPNQFEAVQQKFIYKNSTAGQGVFYTREAVWQVSYEHALRGGLWGAGYGVTIDDKTGKFDFALTSEKYGREKGNTQLAIMEETGLVGLMFYGLSLFFLFVRLVNSVRRWPAGPGRVMMAITTALLFGMIAGSVFEAWWVAPGSPESVYFWVMAGVALGLSATRPVTAIELRRTTFAKRSPFTDSQGQSPAAG